MDKKILVVLFLLVGTALVAAYMRGNFSSAKQVISTTVRIGEREYLAEVVDTIPLKAQGLSGRENLESGRGMLFVFDPPSSQAFWMHGMKFPIDIIWIRSDKVAGIVQNAPVPSGVSVATFTSPGPVDYVLELPAGSAASDQIVEGATVVIIR